MRAKESSIVAQQLPPSTSPSPSIEAAHDQLACTMASKIPRAASTARQLLSQSSARTPASRLARSARSAVFTHVQRRYASGTPHYDPAPPQIEFILKENHAEPHNAEDWKEIGVSALRGCSTQAERDAVQTYITNAIKPTLTDEEIIAVASQVGVAVTTPEELAAAHKVFKDLMKAATLTETETLFAYFERTGEFPADIKTALNESLTKSLASAGEAAAHHDHHDGHGHGHGHGAAHGAASESYGVWRLYVMLLEHNELMKSRSAGIWLSVPSPSATFCSF
jgi:hypothetical protein